MNWLLSPPIAFMIYAGVAGSLYLLGRTMAGPSDPSPSKSATYASGEAAPTSSAAPGYRQFFVIALFFAVLHLGVLVVGTAGDSFWPILYLTGLILTLLAFLLG